MLTSHPLDRLPLAHTLEHTQQRMTIQRASRERQSVSLQRAQAHSHYLYTHGRTKFESALTQVKPMTAPCNNLGQSLPCIHSPSMQNLTAIGRPSSYGRGSLTSRSSSKPISDVISIEGDVDSRSVRSIQLRLDKNTGADAIKQHIKKLNDNYRVELPEEGVELGEQGDGDGRSLHDGSVTVNVRTTPTTCFSEVILVPLYPQMPKDLPRDTDSQSLSTASDQLSQSQTHVNSASIDKGDYLHLSETKSEDVEGEEGRTDENQEHADESAPAQRLDATGSVDDTAEAATGNESEAASGDDGIPATAVEAGAAAAAREGEEEVTSNNTATQCVTSQHTWVDDVTVSSVTNSNGELSINQSDREQGADGGQGRRLEVHTGAEADVVPNEKGQDVEEGQLQQEHGQPGSTDKDAERAEVNKGHGTEDGDAVMGVSEITNSQQLPGYVCPSSVEKSKQLAVREWLRNIDIHGSCKEKPLM